MGWLGNTGASVEHFSHLPQKWTLGPWDLSSHILYYDSCALHTNPVCAGCMYFCKIHWRQELSCIPIPTRVVEHFAGDHTANLYQSLVSPSVPQISCRERLLRLRMKIYKPCSCRHWPTEASGPSHKVWEALCWGMGTGLVPGTGCGGLGQEAGAGCCSFCDTGLEDPAVYSGPLTS